MLNTNEKLINEIKEGSKLIEKNYDLLKNSKLCNESSSTNAVSFKTLNTSQLFDYRHYVFNETELLVGQKVGTKYHYYNVADGWFIDEFTDAKRPKRDIFNNVGRTNLELSSKVRSIITGAHMYITPSIEGELIDKSNMKLDINKNISITMTSPIDRLMLGDTIIEHSISYYGGRNYNLTKDSDGNCKTLYTNDISIMISEYLLDLGFKEEEEIPKTAQEVPFSHLIKTAYNYTRCRVGYDIADNRFYIKVDHDSLYFSIEFNEYKGLKYVLIDSDLFYIEGDTIKYVVLNTEYSASIQNLNLLLSEDREIKFLDNPISKYFRLDNNILVYKNNHIDIDSINATVERSYTLNTVTSSNLEIRSSFDNDKQVIPIKKSIDGITHVFYIIADDSGFYMYLYPGQDHTYQNVLTVPKYYKFNKKKSDVCIYNNLICISECDGEFRCIEQDNFILDSIQTIAYDKFKITGKDGHDYVSNYHGLFRLEFPYEDYDTVSISSNRPSNVVTLKDNSIKVNGLTIESCGDNSVKIQDTEGETILLEHTTIEVDDKSSISLKVQYPYDILRHIPNNIIFDVSSGHFDWNANKSSICFENDNLIIFSLHKRVINEGRNHTIIAYSVYSKISKECINLDDKLDILYSSKSIDILSRNVFYELPGYIYIHGYFVKKDLFKTLGNSSDDFMEKIISIMNKKDVAINSNEEATKFLKENFYDGLVAEAKEYGIDITKEEILNCKLPRELNLILTSLDNIDDCIESTDYKEIFKEIENQLKGKPTLQSELFKNKTLNNESKFKFYGLSLDKFNDFDKVIEFQASSGDGAALKSSICSDMYSQFEILLGSRSKGKEGLLQISNPNTICRYFNMYLGRHLSLGDILTDRMGNSITDKQLTKAINKIGFKYFGLLRKYDISLDTVNNTFIISGKDAKDVKFAKIMTIAKDFINMQDKAISDICQNILFNATLITALKNFIIWSTNHILEAVKNIESQPNLSDDTVENLQIKLWDRYNIIESLTQGSKSHCCLAVNSFNIDKLVQYIYNKHINIVEIRTKHGVIGQAFVSLYRTKGKFNYRYEHKHHLFMIIDNIELNNSYTKYHDDIALNLQKFMNLYMLHTSDKISDVFLGTSMNDIDPPYEFKQYISVDLIGAEHLYLDHSNSFYKFL